MYLAQSQDMPKVENKVAPLKVRVHDELAKEERRKELNCERDNRTALRSGQK
jgi:post-segregation antitoxin (ccd killing protein)